MIIKALFLVQLGKSAYKSCTLTSTDRQPEVPGSIATRCTTAISLADDVTRENEADLIVNVQEVSLFCGTGKDG